VQSLAIPAPVVIPGACTSRQEQDDPVVPQVASWAAKAVACAPDAHASCGRDGLLCVPEPPERAPPPDGFRTCIFHAGDTACPPAYPVYRLFYTAAEDTRACSPCACGEPEGASCSLMATAYSDGACQVPVASVLVSSTNAFCGVVPAGIGLGRRRANGGRDPDGAVDVLLPAVSRGIGLAGLATRSKAGEASAKAPSRPLELPARA
jgi:hypothetical protein